MSDQPQLTYTLDQLNMLIETIRERGWQEAIEAAAQAAEQHHPCSRHQIAAAIRSLRPSPAQEAPRWECTCKGRMNKVWLADDDCTIHGKQQRAATEKGESR